MSSLDSTYDRKNSNNERKNGSDQHDKKRALLITTVSGFVPQFEMNNVRILQELGYEVHYASNFNNPHYGTDNQRLEGTGILCHQVEFVRSPWKWKENVKAYRQLKAVMQETHFELIHCHTPMGSVLGRLAAESVRRQRCKRKKKSRDFAHNSTYDNNNSTVIYTAHGFHFYKGAPVLNWLVYYPVERWLAHYTDKLITINEEDYERAQRFHLRGHGRVFKVNGVGIDLKHYQNITVDREAKRKELGVGEKEFLLLSVGELSKRKNHQVVIRALAELKQKELHQKMRYLIVGEGTEREKLEGLIRACGLTDSVVLLGYRTDISELLAVTDCFVFPSKQEGLPVALLEAAAVGVPCIAADIRGCQDLLEQEMLVKKNQAAEYEQLLKNEYTAFCCRIENQLETEKKKDDRAELRKRRLEEFSEHKIKAKMREIYTYQKQ